MCELCVLVCKDFDNFKVPQYFKVLVWVSVLWGVKTLKFLKFSVFGHCGDCDVVCTNFEIFQFPSLEALRCSV